jgi:hypothetical protein
MYRPEFKPKSHQKKEKEKNVENSDLKNHLKKSARLLMA